MADSPADLVFVEQKLRQDRGLWNDLLAFGVDPLTEWVRCSPAGHLGRWFRLNDGRLVRVNRYSAEWGLIYTSSLAPGPQGEARSGEAIFPLNAWLKSNLVPSLLPEDFDPKALSEGTITTGGLPRHPTA
jgi:hypothetical protein